MLVSGKLVHSSIFQRAEPSIQHQKPHWDSLTLLEARAIEAPIGAPWRRWCCCFWNEEMGKQVREAGPLKIEESVAWWVGEVTVKIHPWDFTNRYSIPNISKQLKRVIYLFQSILYTFLTYSKFPGCMWVAHFNFKHSHWIWIFLQTKMLRNSSGTFQWGRYHGCIIATVYVN